MPFSALSAGMSAGGFDVIDAGIIPTPGVAYLTSVLNVEMGAVISASHNPMPDNGIKFFARGGFKLPDTKARNALFVSHDFAFKAENQVVRQHLIKKYPLTIIFR